ncbi:sensor histidine kinase [Paenibacillus marinisediminis]
MKLKISNHMFYKIYLIYGCLLAAWCMAVYAAVVNNYHLKVVLPCLLAAIFLIAICFVYNMKYYVLRLFTVLDHTIDDAIADRPIVVKNEETELALFIAKLAKYTRMRDQGLRDNNQQKQQIESFIADISHQTKTPISNILLYSELLEEKTINDPELNRYSHLVAAQSQKLKWLISSLIHMSRLENGIIHCDIQQRNLSKLLIDVINSVYSTATKKQIHIEYSCDPQLEAQFDAKWTQEAITNVLENSVKYTPPFGKVSISVEPYELFVRIHIKDTGIGIEESEIPRIFERFYRSEQVSQEEGIGLGLYLARSIITAQKGYMKVQSELEKGSDFSIFLPK